MDNDLCEKYKHMSCLDHTIFSREESDNIYISCHKDHTAEYNTSSITQVTLIASWIWLLSQSSYIIWDFLDYSLISTIKT